MKGMPPLSTSMLGVIGGSGLYHVPELNVTGRREIPTPYGLPSAPVTIGAIGGLDVAFLPRHGAGHAHTPTELPYQANIYALKQLGVTHILSVSAVGSLREALPPLSIVLPDQIIDRSMLRPRSFFDDGAVAHVGLADPFCGALRDQVERAATGGSPTVVNGGCYLCIEGPQFSTRAESELYRSWGASVIGMTAMPEARLAREAELCYATVAMVTDYDVWHETEAAVTVEMVVANLRRNTEAARRILVGLAETGLPPRACACSSALAGAIVTDPRHISLDTRRRLGIIAERYLGPADPQA